MKTILYIGLIQSIFATILIFGQRRKENHHYILGAWMIALTMQFSTDLVTRHSGSYLLSNYNLIIFPFLQGSFIYLYTLFTINARLDFTKKHFLHLIPFVCFSIVFFWVKDRPIFDPEVMMSGPEDLHWIIYVYGGSIFLINITYAIFTHKLIQFNRNEIKKVFSSETNEITLTWIKTIVYLSIFFIITFYVIAGADNYFINSTFNYAYILNIGLTLVVFIISYYGYRQPKVFRSTSSTEVKETIQEEARKEDRYKRSGLKPEQAQDIISRINNYMSNEKPFLNTEFSIYALSEDLGVSQYYITQSLNESLGKNFYTFVNEFRVNEVKQRLIDPKNDHLTVLGIGFESGFNSKSTFYSIFKKSTGKSPSEYKKTICNQ